MPTPTREGYSFVGWFTEKDGGTGVGSTGTYTPTANTTLYAHWSVVAYTLNVYAHSNNAANPDTFLNNAVGGTVKIGEGVASLSATQKLDFGTTASITAKAGTGYSFKGWYTSADFSGAAVSEEATIETSAMTTAGLAYYAKFEANEYTVSLTAGTGIDSVSGAETYLYGAEVEITAVVKAGYTWSKWTGTYETTSQRYSFTMPANNVTMTANATANKYTVKFDGNGATSGNTAEQEFTFDAAQNLRANGFARVYTVTLDGNGGTPAQASLVSTYVFAGWSTTKTGDVEYNNGQSYSVPVDGITLYAIWTPVAVTLVDAERTGYTFAGWNTLANGEGTDYAEAEAYTPTADITLYAQWDVNAYDLKVYAYSNSAADLDNFANNTVGGTVSFNGTTAAKVETEINFGTTATLVAAAAEGYSFAGWYTTSALTGTAVSTSASLTTPAMTTAGLTYYAKFTVNSYSVTVNTNTGITSVSGAATYYYGATVTVDAVVTSGYTWAGWTGTYEAATKNYSFTMPANAVTLTANATPNPYNVTFNGNGATSGNMTAQEFIYAASEKLNAN